MADQLWVLPVVSGAEVCTGTFCPSCSAVMVKLTIGGLHDQGAVTLPDILCCPDCFDPQQVVAEWRTQVQGRPDV